MRVFRVLRRILLTVLAVVAVDALTRSRRKLVDGRAQSADGLEAQELGSVETRRF